MFTRLRCLLAVAALTVFSTGATAVPLLTLTGSLSVGDGGLVGFGKWNDPDTTFSWTVSNEVTASPDIWLYEYTLSVDCGPIKRLIVEASSECNEEFTEENILRGPESIPGPWLQQTTVGTHLLQVNPLMPASMYGIRFDGQCLDGQPTTLTVRFTSDRGPRWGDMYALDGFLKCDDDGNDGHVHNGNCFDSFISAVFNAGFLTDDPLDAIVDSGTVCNHILVPDTGNLIPEPATLGLIVLGAAGCALRRRRR